MSCIDRSKLRSKNWEKREPSGMPLAEAGWYQEEMITAILDLERADRSYLLDSLKNPPFLKSYWEEMINEVRTRKDLKPE